MFPYTSSQPQFYHHRVPRRYIQTADLDDYLQLQLLLQQERERRQNIIAEQERRRALEERRRLEEAMVRLHVIQQLRQKQRLEEERRLRREQRYRAELVATLKAAQEDEAYRRRLLAALERQKQCETARVEHEDALAKKREALRREDSAKREMLEGLLRHIFGHQEQDDRGNDEKIPDLINDDTTAWEKYYRPDPSSRPSPVVHKIPVDYVSADKAELPELKKHVVPLQDLLQNLLANPSELEHHRKPDNAKNPLNNPSSQEHPSSSSSSSVPSKEAENPIPVLSEDQAAAKIQTWYKSAHDAQAIAQATHQFSVLSEISAHIEKVQSEYEQSVLNVQLTFTDPAKDNKRWLQYEDEIMKILVRLDTIESHGSELIRERRKELVNKATALLDRLDEHKQSELERSSTSSTSSRHGDVDVTIDDAPLEGGALDKPEPYVIPEGQGLSSSESAIESNATDVNIAPVSEDVNMAPVSEDVIMAPVSEEVDVAPMEQPSPAQLLSATPGHPHPENPNATTVDDIDNEPTPAVEVSDPITDSTPPPPSSSASAAVGEEEDKLMNEDGFVVV